MTFSKADQLGKKRTRPPHRLTRSALKALCFDMYSRGRDSCEVCGVGLIWPCTFHHVKLKSQGGGDTEDNLMPVCHPCHDIIHRGR